jgi:hypothetical protein
VEKRQERSAFPEISRDVEIGADLLQVQVQTDKPRGYIQIVRKDFLY